MIAAAIALPLASVALLEGTASAKKVTGTGTTTCPFGGTLSFNPPLTPNGSTSVKKEVTTVVANFGTCSGGTPVPTGAVSVKVKPIKVKTAKNQSGGSCFSFSASAPSVTIKAKANWTGEKPSKFNASGLSVVTNGLGELGFTASGIPVNGSYAGSGSLTVYLTTGSSNDIATCGNNTSVSSLTIDQTTSSATL